MGGVNEALEAFPCPFVNVLTTDSAGCLEGKCKDG